ncbi:hypothetical protein ABVK25_005963 [Lepraria finkii]|uniref:Uncharacterized protein n=1 Tax=Lepraria finkii TaxID=1340010 RepID=A0ABR4B9Y8_9LECA
MHKLSWENQVLYFGSSYSEKKSQPPQSSSQSRGLAQETQLFQDFASGGHVESDKNLRALAERENAAARHRKLDTQNLVSFDDATDEDVLARGLDYVKPVYTKSNGQGGTRGVCGRVPLRCQGQKMQARRSSRKVVCWVYEG